jgi:uncharacterized protein YdeI (YjbR/CyaY-like superfamily)
VSPTYYNEFSSQSSDEQEEPPLVVELDERPTTQPAGTRLGNHHRTSYIQIHSQMKQTHTAA